MIYKTKKQQLYFDEVIRLHQEYGYGEDRISQILPIGHATVSKWIRIFVADTQSKSAIMGKNNKYPQGEVVPTSSNVQSLQAEILRLQSQLKYEKLRADAYDELINVAEAKFNIPIRKKAGAKQS